MGEVGVVDEPGEVDPTPQVEAVDRLAERRDVGVEDVAEVADEDQADVGPGAQGERLDQPREVLVRAQAADVEQEARAGLDPVATEDPRRNRHWEPRRRRVRRSRRALR